MKKEELQTALKTSNTIAEHWQKKAESLQDVNAAQKETIAITKDFIFLLKQKDRTIFEVKDSAHLTISDSNFR